MPVLVSQLYCFVAPLPPFPSFCLCATAFITFDLFPVFAAAAEMEMVKLIALLEGGGSQEVPLRIRKFCRDCQNCQKKIAHFAAISKIAKKSQIYQNAAAISHRKTLQWICAIWEQRSQKAAIFSKI